MSFTPLRQARRLGAFTLIEILVVVAILGLLAAILFPAFNSARYSTRLITCQSNERQIGVAMQLYAGDYKGLYPGLAAHPDGCSWSYNIAPYVKSKAVFSCPEALYYSFEPGCPPTKSDGDLRFFFKGAYGFNVPNYNEGVRMSEGRIKNPAQMILVIDGDGDHMGVGKGQKTGPLSVADLTNMAVALRHRNGANALFADGHVKWMSFNSLTDRSHWTLSGLS